MFFEGRTVLLILMSFVATLPSEPFLMYVRIENESRLSISGFSNVTSFACECRQKFSPTTLRMRRNDGARSAYFDDVSLKIQTKKLDCKHRIMNRDMYKTLQAEQHPYISIQLKTVDNLPTSPLSSTDGWTNLTASVNMTIAGETRAKTLRIAAKALGGDRFRFRSTKKIDMTDFSIKPPTAMLGLIKVDETIIIKMDLIVNVNH